LNISWIKNKFTAINLSLEAGFERITKNETAISVYKIVHAAGKNAAGGVNGGLFRFAYHSFTLL
jgi:hypothetical protein